MALLVGRTDLASFTGAAYNGYTVGNANINPLAAVATGSATTLRTGITGFGANTFVRCGIYEQVGGVGAITLIREIDVLASSGTPTQITTISPPLTITAGNEYILLAAGNVTSTATGGEYQWSRDPSITAGLTIVAMDYDAFPATLSGLISSGDGEMYWYLDGDIASPTDLEISFELRESNVAVSNQNWEVTVFADGSMTIPLIPTATISSVSGVVTVNDQDLGDVDDIVWVHVIKSSEASADMAGIIFPETVYDAAV